MGWHVWETMPEVLVTSALHSAFFAQLPTPSPIVHSDRGEQYCSNAYLARLYRHRTVRSHEPPRRLPRQRLS